MAYRAAALFGLATCAQAGDPIVWTAHPNYVLDVFHDGKVTMNPPIPVLIWDRAGRHYNDKEFFEYSETTGHLMWSGAEWCLEVGEGGKDCPAEGCHLQVNICDKTNFLQKWKITQIAPTKHGEVRHRPSYIHMTHMGKEMCITVKSNKEQDGQLTVLWQCADPRADPEDAKMQSFELGGYSPPPFVPPSANTDSTLGKKLRHTLVKKGPTPAPAPPSCIPQDSSCGLGTSGQCCAGSHCYESTICISDAPVVPTNCAPRLQFCNADKKCCQGLHCVTGFCVNGAPPAGTCIKQNMACTPDITRHTSAQCCPGLFCFEHEACLKSGDAAAVVQHQAQKAKTAGNVTDRYHYEINADQAVVV